MNTQFCAAQWCSGIVMAVGGLISSNLAVAQTEGSDAKVVTLEGIEVRGQFSLSELPSGSTSTTHSQLQASSIHDWTDFSRRAEPGVNFNRRNKSINVRGMDADRVVTRIDGVRIPWLTDGARGVQGGLDSVAFDSLSSVDVIRGAGAVRSGALTGSVELHTLRPEDLLRSDRDFAALVDSGYDSADRSWRTSAALAGRFATDTRWLLQLGQRRGHELENYGGPGGYGDMRIQTNPLDYRQNNALIKLEHDIRAGHTLQLSGERFRSVSDIDNRRAQGPGTSFELGQNSTKENIARDRVLAGYQFRSADRAPLDHGQLKLYWQRLRLESRQQAQRVADARGSIIPGDPFRYGYPFGDFERDNDTQETGFGATTEWGGYVEAGAMAHRWSVGGDWYASRLRQESSGFDNCPASIPGLPEPFGPRSCDLLHTGQSDMPPVKGQAVSLWAQDEISWQDGRYAVTPALRFDGYRYRPRPDSRYQENPNADVTTWTSNSNQRVSPSLMFTYAPSDTVSLYASYAYGFKAPNASQLYLNYGAPGSYLSVGNPQLKPETSRGFELGIEAGDARRQGRISVFNNYYRDFIDSSYAVSPGDAAWNPAWDGLYPMGVTTTINRSRVRIYGAEASGRWQMTPQWYGRAAVAWSRGKDLDSGTPLNSIAPLKGSLAVGYETATWGAETALVVAKRRSRVESSDDFKAPGYGVTDFSAWWTPAGIQGLRIQAGVYNVFDKKYWDALNVPNSGRDLAPVAYYTEAGRSWRIGISYQY